MKSPFVCETDSDLKSSVWAWCWVSFHADGFMAHNQYIYSMMHGKTVSLHMTEVKDGKALKMLEQFVESVLWFMEMINWQFSDFVSFRFSSWLCFGKEMSTLQIKPKYLWIYVLHYEKP